VKFLHPRYLLVWMLALLPVAGLLWFVRGPFVLSRQVTMDVKATAGTGEWWLEWQNASGAARNGRWLELESMEGTIDTQLTTAVPNYQFDSLALRWRHAPGVVLTQPAAVTLVERVLWFTVMTELHPLVEQPEGVTLENGAYSSKAPEGGVRWGMPAFTIAQAQDVAVLYVLLIAGFLVVFGAYHLKDGKPWYTPQRAVLLLVIAVHVWFIMRAPLLYCPDSMDYAVNSKLLLRNHTLEHFNAWRLPGYSIFLVPFIGGLHKFSFALGLAQGVLAVITAWLAGRTVRSFLPAPWPALVMLLVGLDPVLLGYARHAMPESLCACLCTLTVFLACRARFWTSEWLPLACLAGAGVGLLIAACCYLRGNMLVLAAGIPAAIAVWPLAERRVWRGIALLLVIGVVAAGALAPWVIRNHRIYDRYEFVVGGGFTRALSAFEAGLLDLNQTAVFTREHWNTLEQSRAEGKLTQTTVLNDLGKKETPLGAATQSLHPWTAKDLRAEHAASESLARAPTTRWGYSLRAFLNVSGLWGGELPGFRENFHWNNRLMEWREPGLNHEVEPTAFAHLPHEDAADIYDRTVSGTAEWNKTDQGQVFARLWTLTDLLRPLWAGLCLLGVLCAIGRRQWTLAILGGFAFVHAGALGFHLLTGIDRYQVPLLPMMSVLAVYGLACMAGVVPARTPDSRTTNER
jgi:hypothetical protein